MEVQATLSNKVSEFRNVLNNLQKAARDFLLNPKIKEVSQEKLQQIGELYALTCHAETDLQQVIAQNALTSDESAQIDITRLEGMNEKISNLRRSLLELYPSLESSLEADVIDEESPPNSPDADSFDEILNFDEDELKQQEGASSERVRSGDQSRLPKAKSKTRATGLKKTKKGKAKGSREKPTQSSKMHPLPQTGSLLTRDVKDLTPSLSENPERLWEKGLELQDLFIKRGQIGEAPLAGEAPVEALKPKRPQDRSTPLLPRLEEILKSSLETIANMSKWALQTLPQKMPTQLPALPGLLPGPPPDLGEVEMKTLFIPESPNQAAPNNDWVSTAKKTVSYLLDVSRTVFENGRNRLLGPPDPPSLNPDGF